MNTRISRTISAAAAMRLAQLSDATLPTGGFSFSCGLETAAAEGVVRDAATLEEFVRDVVRQSQYTDLIAMLHARRAFAAGDYEALTAADRAAWMCKLNDELRTMTSRMGRKLTELLLHLTDDSASGQPSASLLGRWIDDIDGGRVRGTYPAAQGIAFATGGVEERAAAASLLYGAAGVVTGAALRCLRVTHLDTQRILWRLSADADRLYDEVADATLDNIENFSPQLDILAALHEKGRTRMFMN